MIGAFVQVNLTSHMRDVAPIGYVVCESGCWEWVGWINDSGYGVIGAKNSTGKHSTTGAHRALWERSFGKIPQGLELDHLCRNRKCVRLDHLEVVTKKENTLRGVSPQAMNARKTHCARGHDLFGANLYIRKCDGGRLCRICRRAITARYRAKRMAK